jgi:hypothetical protein
MLHLHLISDELFGYVLKDLTKKLARLIPIMVTAFSKVVERIWRTTREMAYAI